MSDEQLLALMKARREEIVTLAERYATRNVGLAPPWFTDAVAAVAAEVMQTNNWGEAVDWFTRLAAAMWQAGYEAAPKMEWVLPEGAGG